MGEANFLHLCKECASHLRSNKLPRFALANNFYRGELPEEFKDLTLVEEMACAIFVILHTSLAFINHQIPHNLVSSMGILVHMT